MVEDFIAKIEGKIAKEVKKAVKRFGDDFDEAQFLETNPRVLGYKEKMAAISKRLTGSLDKEDLEDVKALIDEL